MVDRASRLAARPALDVLPQHALALEQQGRAEAATRLWGARYALGGEVGRESDHPLERAQHDEAVARAEAALGGEAFERAWKLGTAMTLADATGFALTLTG